MKEDSATDSLQTEPPEGSNADVDETLIDWMLSLTPQQRLDVASQSADSIQNLRGRISTGDEAE